MIGRRRGPFAVDGGDVVVALADDERDVLADLLPQLREMLLAADDPALRRLHPPARPDDPEGEAAYREMIDDDLLRSRLESIERVETGLDGGRLDEEAVESWMRGLNDIRLVIGERLTLDGIDIADLHDPDGHPLATIYEWSGYLLGSLVDAAERAQLGD